MSDVQIKLLFRNRTKEKASPHHWLQVDFVELIVGELLEGFLRRIGLALGRLETDWHPNKAELAKLPGHTYRLGKPQVLDIQCDLVDGAQREATVWVITKT